MDPIKRYRAIYKYNLSIALYNFYKYQGPKIIQHQYNLFFFNLFCFDL